MVTGTLVGELSALSDLTAGTNRFESFSEADVQRQIVKTQSVLDVII